MLYTKESRIKAIIYDLAPSNTVKILGMINFLPFVENLGTIYSQDSLEEKMMEQKANVVFVNVCNKMKTGKFSPDQVIQKIKTIDPKAKIILCKSHIGPILKQLYLHQGFDFVIDKLNDFDKIPSLLKAIYMKKVTEVATKVA